MTKYLNKVGVSVESVKSYEKAELCGQNIFITYDKCVEHASDKSKQCSIESARIDLSNIVESKPELTSNIGLNSYENKGCRTIPIIQVHSNMLEIKDEFTKCNLDYALFTHNGFKLLIKDTPNIPKQYNYSLDARHESAWRALLIPVYPVSIAFDIVTFPFQILMIFQAMSHWN